MLLRTFSRNLFTKNRYVDASKYIDHAICIDIECTCDSPVQIYPMEIIELACRKVDLTIDQPNLKSRNERSQPQFHSYVRPIINPDLSLFCQDLTGITQSIVDESSTIDTVVPKLLKWLQEERLIDEKYAQLSSFAFASCGNFDMKCLSPNIENVLSGKQELPIYFNQWINVKKIFVNHKKEWPKSLYHMLDLLGLEPEGRPHSAMDDCKNLARIVESLHQEGCKFHTTSKF